jgi:hypothetical protein
MSLVPEQKPINARADISRTVREARLPLAWKNNAFQNTNGKTLLTVCESWVDILQRPPDNRIKG